MKLPILALAVGLSISCAAEQAPAPPKAIEEPRPEWTDWSSHNRGIYRMLDREAGVICYVYDDYRRAGISCIPLSALTVAAKERLGVGQ